MEPFKLEMEPFKANLSIQTMQISNIDGLHKMNVLAMSS